MAEKIISKNQFLQMDTLRPQKATCSNLWQSLSSKL